MRTSFHHQSEAQPPNGTLTAATSPDTPSYMASQAVGSPMIGCPSPLPAAGVSLTHVAPTAAIRGKVPFSSKIAAKALAPMRSSKEAPLRSSRCSAWPFAARRAAQRLATSCAI